MLVVILATLSCLLSLRTRTSLFSADSVTPDTCDEHGSPEVSSSIKYYSAAGSGVAEVRLIIGGFRLPGYLSAKTLFFKTVALVLSAASGMSLGKEGPYVHLATCISNIVPRLFGYEKVEKMNDILRAGAASGLAVSFGAPISGVVFALEDLGCVAISC